LLPTEKPVAVYLRIKTANANTLAAAVHTPDDMVSYSNNNIAIQSGFIGILVFIFLLNLLYTLRIRDRTFLLFSLCVFFLILIHIGIGGLLVLVSPASAHLLTGPLIGIGFSIGTVFLSLFLLQIYKEELTPWTHRILQVIALI